MQIRNHVINFVLKKPKTSLAISFLIAISFLYPITLIKKNFAGRYWLPQQGVAMQLLSDYEDKFGSDETLSVQLYNPKGILTKENIEYLIEIHNKMNELPGVSRVSSIKNHQVMNSNLDEMIIDPFIKEDVELTDEYVEQLSRDAKDNEDLERVYISKDQTFALIHGHLISDRLNKHGHPEIVGFANEMLRKLPAPKGTKLNFLGIAHVNNEFQNAAFNDLFFLLPLVSVIVFILLWILFRSFWVALSPFVVVGFTLSLTFGFMGILGVDFSNLTSIIPAIMLGIGFADCIHIIVTYSKNLETTQDKEKALKASLHKNFVPTILTTVTTAVGFLSLGVADILPIKHLGFMAALGVGLAWIFTYFSFGPLLKILPPVKLHINWNMASSFNFINRFRYIIFWSFIVLLIASTYLALKNETNNDPIKYFSKNSQVYKDYNLFKEKMGSSRIVQFMAVNDVEGGVKNPDFLRKIEKLKAWAITQDYIQSVTSLSDVVKRFNQDFNEGRAEYYRIPDSTEKVANILFFISLGAPPDAEINSLISDDASSMKITISWNVEDTVTSINKTKEIISKAQSLEIELREGGMSPVYNSMNSMIVETFSRSILWTVVIIFVFMIFMLKSIPFALLAMAPNIIPLTFGAAVLYLSGNFVEIGSVTVWSICLGIAIDDTIHFLVNFQKHYKETGDSSLAIKNTLNNTGIALILTTVVLVIFFGGFAFVEYVPNKNFGIYSSLIIVSALVTDLLFLPAALLLLRKKNK